MNYFNLEYHRPNLVPHDGSKSVKVLGRSFAESDTKHKQIATKKKDCISRGAECFDDLTIC